MKFNIYKKNLPMEYIKNYEQFNEGFKSFVAGGLMSLALLFGGYNEIKAQIKINKPKIENKIVPKGTTAYLEYKNGFDTIHDS